MHIIIAVLGALAAAFWAFTYFMNAANEGREAIGEVKGVLRRGKWSRRIDQRLIENLSDPREAAAVLVYQIAAYDGDVTARQKAQMVSDFQSIFSADDETAEGLYAFARMAAGEVNDAGNSVRKITRPIIDVCSPNEKAQFIEMLERAAEIEGELSDRQRRLIAEVRRALLEE